MGRTISYLEGDMEVFFFKKIIAVETKKTKQNKILKPEE